MWTPELRSWLDESARAAGFDAVGVAEVRGLDDPAVAVESARYTGWVEAGHAGEMEYLKRRDEGGTLVRSSLRVAVPWARSVVVCALNYNADAPRSIDPAPLGAGWIARYAWSGRRQENGACIPTDYHDELVGRLHRIEAGLLAQSACSTRCYVDTGPLAERSVAAQAGVGWIGKNTCVINQQLGSWLLLGLIVTSLGVEQGIAGLPATDRCGSCTRCIDACPTDALLGSKQPEAPRQMDASRCIAYLTIEKKGAIDENLREEMGRQVFGCDICQDVCPWNSKSKNAKTAPAPIASASPLPPREALINPALDWLASLEGTGFAQVFRGSPVERRRRDTSRRRQFRRNLAIAMGNSGKLSFLPQLDTWAAGGDAVLAEAAAWAAARLRKASSAASSAGDK